MLSIDTKEKPEKKAIRFITNTRYPKILMLILTIILAYMIFSNPVVSNYINNLKIGGYLGMFIAGIFFTFGFTTAFSTGYFLTLTPENIYLAAVIGGAGALIGDLFIFKFVRLNFMDEFRRLKNTNAMKKAARIFESRFLRKFRTYLMYAIAGIIIASPLPDEAGVIMLAGLTKIDARVLAPISFIFNSLGILFLVWL